MKKLRIVIVSLGLFIIPAGSSFCLTIQNGSNIPVMLWVMLGGVCPSETSVQMDPGDTEDIPHIWDRILLTDKSDRKKIFSGLWLFGDYDKDWHIITMEKFHARLGLKKNGTPLNWADAGEGDRVIHITGEPSMKDVHVVFKGKGER